MIESQHVPRRARVDGADHPLEEAVVAVLDEGFTRGDGAFETIGVWDGRPFRLEDHLERLTGSLTSMRLPPPDPDALLADVEVVLDGIDVDAALKLFVTGSGTRVVTVDAPPHRTLPRRLVTQPAPWVRPLGTWEYAGAKSLSYGPNMAATRAAQAAGGDDALLVTLEGWVAEGPTFQICWVADGVLHTPARGLGVVDSISRRSVEALAAQRSIPVVAGRWNVEAVQAADEVLVSSSVRPLLAVVEIDGVALPGAGSIGTQLAEDLDRWRRGVALRDEGEPAAETEPAGEAVEAHEAGGIDEAGGDDVVDEVAKVEEGRA